MGEFNSDNHYIHYCGQESLWRNGVVVIVKKKSPKCSTWMQSQKWQNDLCSFPRQTIQYHSNPVYINYMETLDFSISVLICPESLWQSLWQTQVDTNAKKAYPIIWGDVRKFHQWKPDSQRYMHSDAFLPLPVTAACSGELWTEATLLMCYCSEKQNKYSGPLQESFFGA